MGLCVEGRPLRRRRTIICGKDGLLDNHSNLRGDAIETFSIHFDRIGNRKNLLFCAVAKLLLEQMKFNHFAIKAFSTLVALMLPSVVHATDYVQCREMLRVKNEMLNEARQIEGLILRRFVTERCPELNRQIGITLEQLKQNELAVKNNLECSVEYRQKYLLTKKPAYSPNPPIVFPEDGNIRKNFYNPDAVLLVKTAERVARDMKSAKCPY